MKARVGKHTNARERIHQADKGGVMQVCLPESSVYALPLVVKQRAEFCSDDPAMIGQAFPCMLIVASAFLPGVYPCKTLFCRLDAKAVHKARGFSVLGLG